MDMKQQPKTNLNNHRDIQTRLWRQKKKKYKEVKSDYKKNDAKHSQMDTNFTKRQK